MFRCCPIVLSRCAAEGPMPRCCPSDPFRRFWQRMASAHADSCGSRTAASSHWRCSWEHDPIWHTCKSSKATGHETPEQLRERITELEGRVKYLTESLWRDKLCGKSRRLPMLFWIVFFFMAFRMMDESRCRRREFLEQSRLLKTSSSHCPFSPIAAEEKGEAK
jgi:hypothetical protein